MAEETSLGFMSDIADNTTSLGFFGVVIPVTHILDETITIIENLLSPMGLSRVMNEVVTIIESTQLVRTLIRVMDETISVLEYAYQMKPVYTAAVFRLIRYLDDIRVIRYIGGRKKINSD